MITGRSPYQIERGLQGDLMEILVLRQFLVAPVLRKVVVLQGCLEGHVYGIDTSEGSLLPGHLHYHRAKVNKGTPYHPIPLSPYLINRFSTSAML